MWRWFPSEGKRTSRSCDDDDVLMMSVCGKTACQGRDIGEFDKTILICMELKVKDIEDPDQRGQ